MATVYTPPIDLYAESTDFGEEQDETTARHEPWQVRPAENGDRDETAIDAGQGRWDQVLGW